MLKIFTLLLLFASFLFANIGTVSLVEGKATILRNGQTLGANMGDKIENKDVISTQVNSKIKITFIDNTIVTIGKESSLNIEEYIFNTSTKEAKTELNVLKGAFHTITGEIGKVNPDKFKLKTKSASIGIRGTEFYGDENRIVCTQGRIIVLSNSVSVDVPSGNYINIFPNQRPSVPLPLENSTLDNIIERLNTNNQSSNNGVDNLNNVPSSPLALEGSTLRTLDNLDNQNSWGNWNENLQALQDDKNNAILNNSIQNEINSTDNNPAVAITDPSYVQSLIDAANSTQLSFSGTISSTELNPGEIIINNSISLDIYLGGSNSVAGNYNFSTNQLRNYSGVFVNSTVDKDGFWASDFSDSFIEGKYYGQNISSVGGIIKMQYPGGITTNGTFSATR
ncbi:FecR family protein [Aliarcobacter butzleri]|uniref:FecR family protein n=1 Tax=Aliarcobacter butzleri TaxID=28197 RepID=UPI0021B30F48|nr:FecR family protein [Aliarcobacter butzleri]MCT7549484.1 FecR family protein [Aliarcobacter butzleri]MCT7558190.1 FecR family protein [Aliarcobacter butzleri]MCT7636025.1 FecR family protein [Aliarcobacter butzleri]MDK2046155.1 FecR family protein [Aliarcobacter butzleri]MDN5044663.1 FecR family protein [Aliarcobacter butzleri]